VFQFYSNNNESSIAEASYIFPLDSKASVCDFQAEINGDIIQGRAKSKHSARQEFRVAVRKGARACLLEQAQWEVFQVFLGNIPPLSRVNIQITYVVELDVAEEEFVQFVLPTRVAPRYNPKINACASDSAFTYRLLPFCKPWRCCCCEGYHRVLEVVPQTNNEASITRNVPYALSFYLQVQSQIKSPH